MKAADIDKLIRRTIAQNHMISISNYYIEGHECDLFTITRTELTHEFEIKVSKADFNKDFEKTTFLGEKKHDIIKSGRRTNYFSFVIPSELKDQVEVPQEYGLYVVTEIPLFGSNEKNLIVECVQKPKKLHSRKDIDYKKIAINLNCRLDNANMKFTLLQE